MPKVDVYNLQGKKVKDIELKKEIFGLEPNVELVHEAVKHYLANQRQGTQSTKTRAEVRGGGKKPYRQKGTGRARAGSIRSPLWVGGGVVFAPKPRDYKFKMNKKQKQLAVKTVLSSKLKNKDLVVLEDLKLKEIKTKQIVDVLKALKIEDSVYILLPEQDDKVYRSARNISKVSAGYLNMMNIFEMTKNKKILLTEATIKKIEEVYA